MNVMKWSWKQKDTLWSENIPPSYESEWFLAKGINYKFKKKKHFAEVSGGIKSVFCNSTMCGVCLCVYVYAFIYLSLDYIEFFASHIKKKESNPVTVKMPPQMVCPSMWTSVSEKTKAHPVLWVPPTEGPAPEWPSAVLDSTSCVWHCLFTSCSVGFPCSKDTLLFLLAANQVGWPGCGFLAVMCYTLGSCTPWHSSLAPSACHLATLDTGAG